MADSIRSDDEGPRAPEGHLWDYVHVVLRRRTLVLAVFLAVACAAAVRSFLTRPVYQATAQVLIERVDPNVLSFKDVTEEKAGGGIDDYYQTQYKLLQSRTLARHVVETGGPAQRPGARRAAHAGGDRGAARDAPPAARPRWRASSTPSSAACACSRCATAAWSASSFEAFRPELAAQAANALSKALHPAGARPALGHVGRGGGVARHADRRAAQEGRRAGRAHALRSSTRTAS